LENGKVTRSKENPNGSCAKPYCCSEAPRGSSPSAKSASSAGVEFRDASTGSKKTGRKEGENTKEITERKPRNDRADAIGQTPPKRESRDALETKRSVKIALEVSDFTKGAGAH